MSEYRGVEIPRNIGRPQLWTRLSSEAVRIIYPDGKVHWWSLVKDIWIEHFACTSSCRGQQKAIRNCINYDLRLKRSAPKFLGYL